MKTVGYAIVGTGYFGAELGRIMKEQEGAKIVAVLDPENGQTIADELGCDVETDLDTLYSRDDVDAVIVATPNYAESLGVDAIAAIPPIYFHLPEYAIAQYWNDISAAAPNTDFVIYNIPQLAGVALTQGLFAEMRKNPNVIGVKNSSMPVQDIQMFKQAAGPDYIIFNGPDEQFMSGRVIGAEGAIGGTYGVMPELYLKLDEYVRAGKMEEAREIQYACDEIIYKMCSAHGNMYAVIKAILKINEGLELGGVKEPLPGLIDEDSDIVKKAAQMICDAKKKYL